MSRVRFAVLILAGVALLALLVLPSSLANLELLPGTPLNFGGAGSRPGTAGASISGNQFYSVLQIISWIVIITLPLFVYLLIFSKKFRKFFLRSLPIILSLLIILVLYRNILNNSTNTAAPVTIIGTPQSQPIPESGLNLEFAPNPSSWTVILVGLALAIIITSVLGAVLWYWLHRSAPPEDVLGELSVGARQALDDLYAGVDIKNVIIRCYNEMSAVIQMEKGIRRGIAMTPAEFETRLVGVGLPAEAVHQLTQVFEEVRYGKRAPGEREERQAVMSLTAIVDACRGEH